MDFLKGGTSPSSEALLPVDSREKTVSGSEFKTANRQRPASASADKMTYARRTIVALLLCMLVFFGIASGSQAVHCHKSETSQQVDVEAPESSSFPAMLKAASPASLHELLHRFLPDRFRDGVFPSDHQAVEAVHREDAALATTIVRLAKREDANSTASDSSSTQVDETPTPTPTPTMTSTSEPPKETTPSPTPTPPSSSSTSIASSSSPSLPTITSSSSSSSSSSAPPPTHSSSLPGTSSSLRETTSSPASSSVSRTSSSSSPQTPPSSSIPGDTTFTTSTKPPVTTPPPSSSRRVTSTFTTTSPNGVIVTRTTIAYVPAGGETSAPQSTFVPPTLQNSAVRRGSNQVLLTGALGLVMLSILLVA